MWHIIAKELRNVKENLPFNAATIASPLLFLFAFTVMVSGGIALPVGTDPGPGESPFLQSAAEFRAPDGTPYLVLEDGTASDGRSADAYLVLSEPAVTDTGVSGHVVHVVNDVNANMTKNYANRLDGAIVDWVGENTVAGTVDVREHTWYDVDIPWDMSFGVSALVFGAMLAGLLFGMLAMTSEWENATTKLLALSPRSPLPIVAGKIAAAVLKPLVAGAVLVGVVAWMFPVGLANPWHLAAALVLLHLTFASLGLALGLLVRSTMTAFLISLVVALSLWVAGGGFGDLSYFGQAAQVVGALNPATYALDLIRYAWFGGAVPGTHLVYLAAGALTAAVLSTVLFARWSRSERAAA